MHPDAFLFPPRVPAPAPAAHILIIDTDPVACARAGACLSRAGHSVALACTRPMADAMRRVIAFDLIICEAGPAESDANAWVDHLLNTSPTPVILVTPQPTVEDAIRAANRPLGGYIAKPVDPTVLEPLVRRLLDRPFAQKN